MVDMVDSEFFEAAMAHDAERKLWQLVRSATPGTPAHSPALWNAWVHLQARSSAAFKRAMLSRPVRLDVDLGADAEAEVEHAAEVSGPG